MNVNPAGAGLDGRRLERITEHLQARYIDAGRIAGCQVAVARHGQVRYFRSFGARDLERAAPVEEDTIWRIYSMTKPITGVALMSLYEHGMFQLADPVTLTVAVAKAPAATQVIGSPGEYMWGGAASTLFWVDPAEDLTVVFMTQLLPSGTFNFRGQLKALVYPAIVD
jgi:CubicO group peptidase (beta-lactamase class C family)